MIKTILILTILVSFNLHAVYSIEELSFLHSPCNQAQVDTHKPNISFSFGSIKVRLSTVKVFLDGAEVTSNCIILPRFLSYKPEENLAPGRHDVKITFNDQNSKKYTIRWAFSIRKTILIKSITHNADEPLMEREKLVVRVIGKPGGKACFTIPNIILNAPMKEISKGIYEGEYRVHEYDNTGEQPVCARLVMPDGTMDQSQSKKKVSIFARLFRLKIISPKEGERVTQKFFIKGRTRPNMKVIMTISLSYKTLKNLLKANGPETGGIETKSDKNGYFEKEFGFPVSINNLKAVITAYARDEKGNKSMMDSVTIYLDREKDIKEKQKNKKKQ